MILQGSKCYLRDPIIEDMKEFREWYQPDQEWLQWDAPWQTFHSYDFAKLRSNLEYQIACRHNGAFRQRFELCTNDHIHIGWVSRYDIHGDKNYLAIGIDIVPLAYRNKGYGKEAYILFIKYLLSMAVPAIFTQTWSGNEHMIRLAKATCFQECNRILNAYPVRGNWYDEITFQLNIPRFYQTFCG